MNTRVSTAVILASLGLAGPLAAQTITEFPIPTADSEPIGIAAGPDGNLWFTESSANKIGRITTAGSVTEFPVSTGSYPFGIAAGADGNMWFIEQVPQIIARAPQRIGRITAAGVVTEFPLPTLYTFTNGITLGPDGNIWFTEGVDRNIGRITPAGVITEFPVQPSAGGSWRIVAGPDGNLWFTDPYANQIGRITPAGVVTAFPITNVYVDPWDIAAGPDGNLWFTEQGSPNVGRITTAGVVTEFPDVDGGGQGITAGPDGNLWFTMPRAGKIGRLTTTGVFTEYPGATEYIDPGGITAGPDGAVWFTGSANTIGRITTSPCSLDARTLCLNGGRFSVTADWQIPSKGTSGHGTATRLTPDAGYFLFFDDANVEAVVKVLNGCNGPDGHYWVFAAGLTNVGVTLTVTDMQTDQRKTYTNPDGHAFEPVQDTSAFATCP